MNVDMEAGYNREAIADYNAFMGRQTDHAQISICDIGCPIMRRIVDMLEIGYNTKEIAVCLRTSRRNIEKRIAVYQSAHAWLKNRMPGDSMPTWVYRVYHRERTHWNGYWKWKAAH